MGHRESVGPEEDHGLEELHLLAIDEVVDEVAAVSSAVPYFPNSRPASSSRLNSKCSATSARMPERVPTRSGLWLGIVR